MDIIKHSRSILSGYVDSRQGGRSENQDSYDSCECPLGTAIVVCDGMGGGPAGKIASTIAVKTIIDYLLSASSEMDRINVVQNAISYANCSILEYVKNHPNCKGMGTTLALLLVNKHSAIAAHVGDSRIYQLRLGSIHFRSADHSYVGELVRNGSITEEQARLSSESNIITRALGGGNSTPDVVTLSYERGDRFVLCTDGIWGMLPEKELVKKVLSTRSLQGCIESMMIKIDAEGNRQGGTHDNFTFAILETKVNSKLIEPMNRKIRYLLISLSAICLISILCNIFIPLHVKHNISKASERLELLNSENSDLKDQLKNSMNQYNENKNSLDDSIYMSKRQIKRLQDEIEDLKRQIVRKDEELQEKSIKAGNASYQNNEVNNSEKSRPKLSLEQTRTRIQGIIAEMLKTEHPNEQTCKVKLNELFKQLVNAINEAQAMYPSRFKNVQMPDKSADGYVDSKKGGKFGLTDPYKRKLKNIMTQLNRIE